MVAGWAVLYALRVHDHFANVDDWLYAAQASAIRHGMVSGWRAYPTSSPLVPTLGAPLTALSRHPTVLVLAELPLLLALWYGVLLLADLAGVRRPALAATLVALTPAVLGYAVMWHFAVAATAALVWSLVAYLRSDQLRARGWSVVFGVLVGVLSLTRIVAVVYIAALAAVCACDLTLDRGDVRRRAGHLALAVAAGGAVAAPWWLVAGRQATHYLRYAGYDTASGFTTNAALPVTVWRRVYQTAGETGLVVLVLLGVLLVVALARHPRRTTLLPAAVALLGFALLGTSGNLGTAFALPVEVVAAVAAATVVRSRRAAVVVVAVAAVSTLGQFGALRHPAVGQVPLWVETYPARGQAQVALGSRRDIAYLHDLDARVAARLDGTALLVRDDVLLNWNGLAAALPAGVALRVAPYAATALDLDGVTTVVAGHTPAPYHHGLDPDAVERALRAAGFVPVLRLVLSDVNDVTVWRSG